MCGIAGIASRQTSVDAEAVRRMVDALARRGPDGEGVESWTTAVLGHRRLAIFDLSEAGHQPMVSPDGKIGVVFNGAIYNFKELRAELEGRGCHFRTATDTEVLLHGFQEWGIQKLLSRLRGMFAFALWDDRERRLFLVRDRLGVKPLVFVAPQGEIAFASTVRALRVAGRAGEVDEDAVAEYLQDGFVSDDRSIYRDVLKVPASGVLEWQDGHYTISRYWSPIPDQPEARLRFSDAVSETERLLLEAVSLRLQADVPVGVLLSSGIDSSLICWAVARLGGDITAFTVGVPGDPWDETAEARATAQSIGIEHRVLSMAKPSATMLTDLTEAYAEPFACASALGMLSISEAVSGEATVLLTGDGGDDVFLGYPRHRHLFLAQGIARGVPRSFEAVWPTLRRAIPNVGSLRRARSLGDYVFGGQRAFQVAGRGLAFYDAAGILGPRMIETRSAESPIRWSVACGRAALDDYLQYAYRTQFVGEYMTKVDGATMHYGLEARSPFLDQELWTFAASLPAALRLRGFRLKAVLRALAKKHIGRMTAGRPKRGFGIPVQRWLADVWYDTGRAVWEDSLAQQQGWIKAVPVAKLLEESRSTGIAPMQLWYLLVLELWLRREQTEARSASGEHFAAASL